MILLDTNVIIDARDDVSPFKAWANKAIENAVADDGEGATINAVTLAELCAASGVDENAVAGMNRAASRKQIPISLNQRVCLKV